MEILFLGTSSMVPTKDRNHSAVLLSYKDEGILFDCGEGVQRQLKVAGIRPTKITKILITHWHGDHMLGLPGLVQTLGASEYQRTLEIYGPEGTEQFFKNLGKAFYFDIRIKVVVKDIKKGIFFKSEDFNLEAAELEHGVPCLGYSFIENDRRRINIKETKKLGIPEGPLLGQLQQSKSITFKGKKVDVNKVTSIVKGQKITFISDTRLCNNAVQLAKNADILICESTFTSDLEEKGEEYGHMTAKQAAQLANQANVTQLILTHFSQRYKNTQEIEEEARTYFDNVLCAKDFMKINL